MDLRSLAKAYLPSPVAGAIKMAKYKLETWTFPRHVVSHRYGPYQFDINIHDRVAKEWYDKDWDLPPEIEFLSHHGLKRGALVFDLGAHQCVIAIMLAKQVAPHGRIVAVEANKHNVGIATRNLASNRVTNVDVLHALVSSAVGKERAAASSDASRTPDGGQSIASDVVNSVTIDEISHRVGLPDVVYMDVDGFEIEALKGAKDTLARLCTWFIELHGDELLSQYGARNRDVLQFFPSSDYVAFVCAAEGREFHPLLDGVPRERCYTVFVPKQAAPGNSWGHARGSA